LFRINDDNGIDNDTDALHRKAKSNFWKVSMISYVIIALNVVVFLLVQQNPHLMQKGMLIPYRMVRQGSWYELLSSGFLHGGWTHLLFNMITLLFFGPVLERSIGEVHFFMLYSSGLLFSSLPSLYKHKNNPNYATIGASGAVESVLFAFIVLFPFTPLYLMFIPIGIPAVVFGVMFVIYSIWAGRREGQINHEAHLAGAFWGLLYMLFFVPNTIDHILTIW
jgi:membrane associated rhomboid family serine protease